MNPLAHELNTTLEGTAAGRLLSRLGSDLYFPKGIVAQTSEANARANRYNATVGMAFEDGDPIMLSGLKGLISGLNATESVAYAPTPGVPALRAAWKETLVTKNPGLAGTVTSSPMVTAGLTNGLLQLAEMFIDSEDALVLPDMFWGNYRLMFEVRRNARLVTFPLFTDAGGFNAEGLAETLQGNTKSMVLLNFPNNPTGYTPSREEADRIVDVLTRHAEAGNDILAVLDDAYFGLFYDDTSITESLFARCADAHERILAVKVDGATKEDFAWGFRIGFVTFAGKGMTPDQLDALEKKLMGSIRSTVSNCSRIAQSMVLKALSSPTYESEKLAKRALLKARYQEVRRIVSDFDMGPLTPLPFNSGYFMAFDCGLINAEALRLALLDKGIGTIAIGVKYLRVAYSTVDQRDLSELYAEIFTTAKELVP